MFALRRLAELLHFLPRTSTDATPVAAAPFTLPSWIASGAQWADLVGVFDASITITTDLLAEAAVSPADRRLLVLMRASDERKRLEAAARRDGTSVRTRRSD